MSEMMDEPGSDHPLAAAHGDEEQVSLASVVLLLQELVGIARFEAGYGLIRTPNTLRAAAFTDAVAAVTSGAVTLLRANPYRRGCAIFNDATGNLFLKLGRGATTDDWTIKIAAGGYYEPPASGGFRGEITGVWDALGGQARVTEYS